MLNKEQEDYLFKLKAELLFRGKDEEEVHAIGDELQDHFETAEQNGDDVSDILNTPVKDYADNFSKEMSFTKGLPKYLTYFVLFMFAIYTIPDLFNKEFELTVGYILNVIFIFAISIIAPLFLLKKIFIKYGEQKKVYLFAFIGGAVIFGLMFLSTYISKHYPIYTIATLSQTQSIIVGIILLAIVMIACFIVKQKMFALIVFIVCLPNIIAQLFKAHSHSDSQFAVVSLIASIILLILMNIAFFTHAYYTNRKEKDK